MNPAGYLCVSTTTMLGTTIREGQGTLPAAPEAKRPDEPPQPPTPLPEPKK
jgi:hypothetical protein